MDAPTWQWSKLKLSLLSVALHIYTTYLSHKMFSEAPVNDAFFKSHLNLKMASRKH